MFWWWLLRALASSLLLAHMHGEPVLLLPSQAFPKPEEDFWGLNYQSSGHIGSEHQFHFFSLREDFHSFSGPFTL